MREIEEVVMVAIGKGEIALPSFSASGSIIAKRLTESNVESVGDDLAPIIYGEKELLEGYVLRKIHRNPNTRGLIIGAADDATPATYVRDTEKALAEAYSAIGMAEGQATAERHFRTIEGLAKKLVQEKYPQFARHQTEVGA